MKLSAAPYVLLAAVTTSLVSGAAVQPTAAPLVERQLPTDPAVLSSIFANPSSALAAVSSLLTIPAVSSAFRSIATDPAYLSEISGILVSEYGTQTGQLALQSYEAVVNSLLGGGAIQTSAAAKPTSTSGSAAVSSSKASSSAAAPAGSTTGSSSSSGTNAAGSLFTLTAMGSAVVAGAIFVAAAL